MKTIKYYRPTSEAIEKLKPGPLCGLEAGDQLERAKTIATIYAMQDHQKDSIDSVYIEMYYHLKRVYDVVRYRIRKEYYESLKDEGEVRFVHYRSLYGDTDWDFERTMSWKVKWFTQQAILVPTADYYENPERFNTKDSILEQELDAFVESMEEVCRHDIEIELYDFKFTEEDEED